MNIRLMSSQLAYVLSGRDVPYPYGVFTAARRQTRAVGTERQSVHPVPVRQDMELLVRVRVPEAHIAAPGATRD